jgi:hypothetical protein
MHKQQDRNMDNLRGFDPFGRENQPDSGGGYTHYDSEEADDHAIEAPPVISGDERRMQVRAYNFWTSQLNEKNYPGIEELNPESVEDFRDYSVLLDFTSGIENPSIQFLGEKLRAECGISEDISYLDEVPPRSLLSRITDHYLQIIANRAPIGFEAEFVNEADLTIMYRGILLPYSSDDDTIDFIYGVINWKIAAEAELVDELEAEVAQALQATRSKPAPVPVWEDSPSFSILDDDLDAENSELLLDTLAEIEEVQPDENSSLGDWLSAARNSAESARDEDARSRTALYKAIGRAYDFSLAAEKAPEDFAELLADAGLKQQVRAPMTPIVKLVFGATYDKTRITEFSAALDYALRNAVPMGGLADLILGHSGGLKGIVKAERIARKVAKTGNVEAPTVNPRARLRNAPARSLEEFAKGSDEFVVLIARRETDGSIVLIGSAEGDKGLTEKALSKAAG